MIPESSPLISETFDEHDGKLLVGNLLVNGLCPLQACQHPCDNEELLSLNCTCGMCDDPKLDGIAINATSTNKNKENGNDTSAAIQHKIDKHAHYFARRRQCFIKKEHDLIASCVKARVQYQPPDIGENKNETKKRRRELSNNCKRCYLFNATTQKIQSSSIELESEIKNILNSSGDGDKNSCGMNTNSLKSV